MEEEPLKISLLKMGYRALPTGTFVSFGKPVGFNLFMVKGDEKGWQFENLFKGKDGKIHC